MTVGRFLISYICGRRRAGFVLGFLAVVGIMLSGIHRPVSARLRPVRKGL